MKGFLNRIRTNYKGTKISTKILVIESDDWGSIRTPSIADLIRYEKQFDGFKDSPYNRFDSIESQQDLEILLDTLSYFKDLDGRSPVLTMNFVVANPDFDKIRSSDFLNYHYEPFSETYTGYNSSSNLSLIRQGMESGMFRPQFHSREHINWKLWLNDLQQQVPDVRAAFDFRMACFRYKFYNARKVNIYASYDAEKIEDLEEQKVVLTEGTQLFYEKFNFRSESFIANNYTWDPLLNETLAKLGVRFLQGMRVQKHPIYQNQKREITKNYLGKKNEFDQFYLIRNSLFEPALFPENYDVVGSCLKDIAVAFRFSRPAIISSHRLNYISRLSEQNRDRSISLLNSLLRSVLKIWPDTRFLSSDQLGNLIRNKSNVV